MNNKDLIKDFIEAWNNLDLEKVVNFFAEDIFYHNIPMEPLNGKSEASTFVDGLKDCDSINWELIAIAEEGNKVLTERLDSFNFKDGRKISIPVMGTFEIENNKIKKWRDYFDLETFQKQMAGHS